MTKKLEITADEANLIRQWYCSVCDTNPRYLEQNDAELYTKLMDFFGWRVSQRDAQPNDSMKIIKLISLNQFRNFSPNPSLVPMQIEHKYFVKTADGCEGEQWLTEEQIKKAYVHDTL